MKKDMRGVLFIVRGQYRRDKGERFFNEVSNTYHHIGGYDPSDSSNPEWYMLVENLTFHTLACGSDLEKVVKCARFYINKYPTQVKFRKMLDTLESKDSPITKRIMEEVYKEFGHTYEDLIDGVVDTTYEEVLEKKRSVLKKSKKVLKTGVSMSNGNRVSSAPEVSGKGNTPFRKGIKTGIRKLSMA